MVKVLANDGIAPDGKQILEDAGFQVRTEKIEQGKLADGLNAYDAVLVRSATKITAEVIDANPNLKLIGRAGVGLDNIDVRYAEDKGIHVINTPAASSLSVAELVMAHLGSLVRHLHKAHRDMPDNGASRFKALKKSYSKGTELRGKTLGVIGIGRIGQETAKLALGMGMNVISTDPSIEEVTLELGYIKAKPTPSITITTINMEELLRKSDFISLHVPSMGEPLITSRDFNNMKDGVIILNCARGGVIDENALLEALENGKVGGAGLDVFNNEPTPDERLLKHPNVSATPHTGGSTVEAQARIGIELAEKTVKFFQ